MDKSTIEDQFKSFAESRLQNHLAEINTRYENEKPDTNEREEAGKAHRKIFEEELKNKIKELNPGNPEDLETLKSGYLEELK